MPNTARSNCFYVLREGGSLEVNGSLQTATLRPPDGPHESIDYQEAVLWCQHLRHMALQHRASSRRGSGGTPAPSVELARIILVNGHTRRDLDDFIETNDATPLRDFLSS